MSEERIRIGDNLTVEGVYERRTLWQWLLRKPRRLKRMVITDECASDMAHFASLLGNVRRISPPPDRHKYRQINGYV